jgi:hypothetical protein
MNAQSDNNPLSVLDKLGQRLMPGQARRVGPGAGELTVLSGRVWLTRPGDEQDRVLEPGHRLNVSASERVVMESLDRTAPASVVWRPRGSTLQRLGLRGVFAGALAGVLAALARRAASSASRAQGCMS